MKNKYYLSIDIGASSGRHILAHLEGSRIVMEEIYRFPNKMIKEDGVKVWNVDLLFREIITGMARCRELNKIPVSVGIDTWGVDYILLDRDGKRIGKSYAYRDKRTVGIDEEVYKIIGEEELYRRTGIQRAQFNTVFQLFAHNKEKPEELERAEHFLMLPDYFNYLLCGEIRQEYTNCTTTGLVNPRLKSWDTHLINILGLPEKLFHTISKPGQIVGKLSPEIIDMVGYDCAVILTASHDTASAFMAVPAFDDKSVFLSSGTWSLMGCERAEADCSINAEKCNFTNEGGYNYRFRFLKNIMGLWMIQCVRNELAEFGMDYSFEELSRMAERVETGIALNVNDPRFMAPDSMIDEVRQAIKEQGVEIPRTVYEIASIIYNSLAESYAGTVKELQEVTGRVYNSINIVGGGSHAEYLNRLTAEKTGMRVYAGPSEATALGNLGVQMIAGGAVANLSELRNLIRTSTDFKVYE